MKWPITVLAVDNSGAVEQMHDVSIGGGQNDSPSILSSVFVTILALAGEFAAACARELR